MFSYLTSEGPKGYTMLIAPEDIIKKMMEVNPGFLESGINDDIEDRLGKMSKLFDKYVVTDWNSKYVLESLSDVKDHEIVIAAICSLGRSLHTHICTKGDLCKRKFDSANVLLDAKRLLNFKPDIYSVSGVVREWNKTSRSESSVEEIIAISEDMDKIEEHLSEERKNKIMGAFYRGEEED